MYSAEQISIPPELGTVLKQYTKAVIRDRPSELYKFSANFFAHLCGQAAPFDEHGQLLSQQQNRGATTGSNGQMVTDVIADAGNFESVNTADDVTQERISQIFKKYDTNQNGRLERDEVPALIDDLRAALGLADNEGFSSEELLSMLDSDEDGTIDLLEFRQLFFQSDESGL
jgi:Ca2+-binding EF-hand superfamily protein